MTEAGSDDSDFETLFDCAKEEARPSLGPHSLGPREDVKAKVSPAEAAKAQVEAVISDSEEDTFFDCEPMTKRWFDTWEELETELEEYGRRTFQLYRQVCA
jgi:hypothetical protein